MIKPAPVNAELPNRTVECMPAYSEIPVEFTRWSNPWSKWATKWFFDGLDSRPRPNKGIDEMAALRHLAYIMGSFDTKHEHKIAAVAYLASLWFREPN